MKKIKLWIASDKDGTVFIYRSKPERVNEYNFDLSPIIGSLNSDLVPSVTWENSPQEIEIKLIESIVAMNYEEFKSYIMAEVKKYREPFIREGQAVFNIVESHFGVARTVQFEDHIDCFRRNQDIDAFLQAAWKRIEPNLK